MQGPPEQNLVVPLLVLICRNRERMEIHPDAKDIKFISSQYDNCQQAFLQVPPLCSSLSRGHRNMLLQPVQQLPAGLPAGVPPLF